MKIRKIQQADLSAALREYALSLDVELYGVSSAEAYARSFPEKQQPREFVDNAHSIVVIGIPFEPTTVATVLRADDLVAFYNGNRQDPDTFSEPPGLSHLGPASTWFLSDEKMTIYGELNWIGYRMTKWLRQRGWSAFHFSVNRKDRRTLRAPFEHLPAMYLAGLGTMGLNCCILTPEFGPRVLVTSIITDCELQAGEPMTRDLCTRCRLCVKSCPVGAIDGKGWKDPFACLNNRCCARCIAVCPVGDLKVPNVQRSEEVR